MQKMDGTFCQDLIIKSDQVARHLKRDYHYGKGYLYNGKLPEGI